MNHNNLSSSTKLLSLHTPTLLISERQRKWSRQMFEPGSDFVNRWNLFYLFTCLSAVDPLYFFVPEIREDFYMSTNTAFAAVITIWRCIIALFSSLHILLKFRTAYVAPNSRVFAGENSLGNAIPYLTSSISVLLFPSLSFSNSFLLCI